MSEATRKQDTMDRAEIERDRIVSKGDLDDAKTDLRREMKLWLGAGSAIGTAVSGLLAAGLSPARAVEQVESLARATGLY